MIAVGGLIRLVGPPLRGAGSFEIKFDVGFDPATGKRKTRYVSFKGNKRDAELELARLVSEHKAGLSRSIARPKPSSAIARSSKIRSSRTSALL